MKPSLQLHYQGLESNEVLERADAIRSLMQHPGWAVLTEAIELHEGVLVERLVRGKVQEHEAYAKAAGEINGLHIATETADKILGLAEQLVEKLRAGGAGEEADTHG